MRETVPMDLPQSVFKNCVSGLSVFRSFTEFWGASFQYGETKALFSQARAALWFVKAIENENWSGSGSSSQAVVFVTGVAEDQESCWGCLGVRACVFFL